MLTKRDSEYIKLLNNSYTSIVGIWDDHDYGRNDGKLAASERRKLNSSF